MITMQSIAGKYRANSGRVELVPDPGVVCPGLALGRGIFESLRGVEADMINPFKWRLVLALSIPRPVAMLGVLLIEPVLEGTIYELFDRTAVGLSLFKASSLRQSARSSLTVGKAAGAVPLNPAPARYID